MWAILRRRALQVSHRIHASRHFRGGSTRGKKASRVPIGLIFRKDARRDFHKAESERGCTPPPLCREQHRPHTATPAPAACCTVSPKHIFSRGSYTIRWAHRGESHAIPLKMKKIISASAMAAAALENAIGCVLRRRLWRHLTCARVPNDLPACPVVIHRNSSPHSAFPRHVTRKLDSVRGRAEIASGWPAAPAGSSQQVSDLVPIIGPGLCTRGCPRDGVPRSCMHMPHRVLGRPEFGSGGPTTLPGEALWVPQ